MSGRPPLRMDELTGPQREIIRALLAQRREPEPAPSRTPGAARQPVQLPKQAGAHRQRR